MNILHTSPLEGLNKAQRAAVEQTEGPVLVLAGAGSGKTRVLVHRVAHIVGEGLARPWQVLAMTFTNKAAKELKSRVEGMVQGGDEVAAGTFHSTFLRLLKRETDAIGYPKDFTVFDDSDSRRLVKLILKDMGEEDTNFKSVRVTISRLKNDMISPKQAESIADSDFQEVVAKAYAEYETRLIKHAAMDFDDLLLRPIKLFKEHPSILNKWTDRWRYIHVDEYQDTNLAQFELIKLLAGPKPNLFVVGDDDQSIYGWRGARVENIFQYRSQFSGAKVFRLEQNYRSTQSILDLAHVVVSKSERREEKKLWTDRSKGNKPVLIEVSTDADEAAEVADRILREVSKGDRRYADCAVLYRTNGQSRLFEDSFRSKRIPYQVIGAKAFYDRKEVRDAVSYFKLCLNPRDEVALRRIIAEPPRGIGGKTLDKLVAWAVEADEPLTEAMRRAAELDELTTRQANACTRFAQQIDDWRDVLQKDGSLSKWAKQLLQESGYIDRLKSEKFEGETRLENIEALIDGIADFEQKGGHTLAEYLEETALATDVDRYDPDEDSVRLMTAHAAKGLEFPLVFVTGLEEKLFPLENEWSDRPQDIDEERRLFYVAVTRAMDELVLTTAVQRMKWGQQTMANESRFIRELPKKAYERVSRTSSLYQGSLFGTRAFQGEVSGKGRYSGSKPHSKPSTERQQAPRGAGPRNSSQQEPEELLAIHAGELVEHHKLGKGIVLNIQAYRGDQKVTVEFDGESYTLMQSKARLQPVKD